MNYLAIYNLSYLHDDADPNESARKIVEFGYKMFRATNDIEARTSAGKMLEELVKETSSKPGNLQVSSELLNLFCGINIPLKG